MTDETMTAEDALRIRTSHQLRKWLSREERERILATYAECERLRAEQITRRLSLAREALQTIARGEGRYSRDPLQHAENCINAMVQSANDALAAIDAAMAADATRKEGE